MLIRSDRSAPTGAIHRICYLTEYLDPRRQRTRRRGGG